MRLTLNYSVMVVYACTYPYKHLYPQSYKDAFIATNNPYNLNEVFLKSESLSFRHKRNFNPKFLYVTYF